MKLKTVLERQDLFRDIERAEYFEENFYHGTSTVLDLEVGDHILPPAYTDTISERGRKKNLDVIFLTPDYNYAKIYAGRAVRELGGEPIIYEVKPIGLEFYRQEQGNNIYIADGGIIYEEYIL